MNKRSLILVICCWLMSQAQLKSWWDPGHMVIAMIAYENLAPHAKQQVDAHVKWIERDYPYINHFVALSTWADDLKGEGVRVYDSWHYTNLPYNPYNIALPTMPKVNVVWAIEEARKVLASDRAREVEQARQLGFLTHFVGDIHQPLHSTSYYSQEVPGGDAGGNAFPINSFGKWRNLHMCWDDGCGYLSEYNDINPYGTPKDGLTEAELERIKELAHRIMEAHPLAAQKNAYLLDPDFWTLESHKLAIEYGYRGVLKVEDNGRKVYIQKNDAVSEYYLDRGRKVVEEQLAVGGYRLAGVLNEIFVEDKK
ncbi:MAG: S1/P1 nuclease [Bacteroidota bacterium]